MCLENSPSKIKSPRERKCHLTAVSWKQFEDSLSCPGCTANKKHTLASMCFLTLLDMFDLNESLHIMSLLQYM